MTTDTDKEAPMAEEADHAASPPPSRTGARIRLALAALAFLGWIGYLLFLAIKAGQPVVVSRPQLLASHLDVIAELSADQEGKPNTGVVIDGDPLWAANDQVKPKTKTIQVGNLAQAIGWKGPGQYLLLLVPRGSDYVIAPVALSPGRNPGTDDWRIYPVSAEVLRQQAAFRAGLPQ